jgi:hypothetical protein
MGSDDLVGFHWFRSGSALRIVLECEVGMRFWGDDDRGRLETLVKGLIGLEKPRFMEAKLPPFLT